MIFDIGLFNGFETPAIIITAEELFLFLAYFFIKIIFLV